MCICKTFVQSQNEDFKEKNKTKQNKTQNPQNWMWLLHHCRGENMFYLYLPMVVLKTDLCCVTPGLRTTGIRQGEDLGATGMVPVSVVLQEIWDYPLASNISSVL